MPDPRIVNVEVHGQRYPIRSGLDPKYVAELAAYVDLKMRAASDAAPASDMLGLAVLVALTRPPCRATTALTMDSPSPLPREAMPLADDVL